MTTILPIALLGLLTSLVFGAIVAPFAIQLANRIGMVDFPNTSGHKKHRYPTPLAGGTVIGISFVLLTVFFPVMFSDEIWAILLATFIILFFGLLDDLVGLKATWKFSGQVIASFVLIYLGVQISFVEGFSSQVNNLVNVVLTLFWLIGLTNAFNLVDSADGLSLSLAIIASVLLIFASLVSQQGDLVFLSASLLGVCLGLLFYNLSPARLFLGDSGVQSMGFFLAAMSILYNPSIFPQESSWFVPITLLAVPIFDVCLVFFSRIWHKIPFYRADLNHTYHRLRTRGFSHLKAVWLMDLAAILSGIIGLYALYQNPIEANSIFFVLIFLGFLLIIILERN